MGYIIKHPGPIKLKCQTYVFKNGKRTKYYHLVVVTDARGPSFGGYFPCLVFSKDNGNRKTLVPTRSERTNTFVSCKTIMSATKYFKLFRFIYYVCAVVSNYVYLMYTPNHLYRFILVVLDSSSIQFLDVNKVPIQKKKKKESSKRIFCFSQPSIRVTNLSKSLRSRLESNLFARVNKIHDFGYVLFLMVSNLHIQFRIYFQIDDW